jgi:hypothetical protein
VSSFTVKPGVVLPPVLNLAVVVAEVMAQHSVQCVITSGTDGKHKAGSLHYADKALDFRSRGMALPLQQLIATQVRERLGPNYDCIVESDHFHGEFDPKG